MSCETDSPLQSLRGHFQEVESLGQQRINDILEMNARGQQKMDKIPDDILIPLLVQRSCHLPGNSWWQDWFQFMRNSHVLFGICFHHRKHPIETWERFIVLSGSVGFSMCATNIGYIYDWYTEDVFDPSAVAFSWTIKSVLKEGGYQTLVVTKHMILCLIFGSMMHSLFDYFVWNLSACSICHPGGIYGKSECAVHSKDLGSFALIPVVGFLLFIGVYSSYLRATTSNEALHSHYGDNKFDDRESKLWDYFFLAQFETDLMLTWFVVSPIIATTIFSGILGCNGRLPVMGGRPAAIKTVEEMLKEHENVAEVNICEENGIEFVYKEISE